MKARLPVGLRPDPARVLGVALLGALAACGGRTGSSQSVDASSAATDADDDRTPPPTSDAAPDDAATDAGDDGAPSCDDLEDAAQAGLAVVLAKHLACSIDSDCASIFLGDGMCASPCSVLTDEAGVDAVESAALTLCQPFMAKGCPPPDYPCTAPPPSLCAGGTCAVYTLYATQVSASLAHGGCTAFQVNYKAYGGTPAAPHDMVVTLTSSGGTLYADATCTTPLGAGSVTIAAGSTSAPFGFTPSAAGLCWIFVEGVVSSWTAR